MTMTIRTTFHGSLHPSYDQSLRWSAIGDNIYDGPGSLMGWGVSEAAAIADLIEQLAETMGEAYANVQYHLLSPTEGPCP